MKKSKDGAYFGMAYKDEKYDCCFTNERGEKKNKHEYNLWIGMLTRCYSEKTRALNKTYEGCEVDDFFLHYSNFYEWCNEQIGFKDGFELDKDLLNKGNRIYSPNNCLFLPKSLNTALTRRQNHRGKYLIGVTFDKNRKRFASRMGFFGKVKTLGNYKTELEAFNAYKAAKEAYLKELAEKWKSEIDPRAYDALINYQVEMTD